VSDESEATGLIPRQAASVPAEPCQQCGSSPAATVTFEGDIKRRSPAQTTSGRFCRDCGVATFRATTAWCLTRGWLSLYSVITVPLSVVANLSSRRQVARLGSPQSAGSRASALPLGRTLWLRWQILGALIPPLLVASSIGSVVWAINARHTAAKQTVGKCVMMSRNPPSVFLDTKIVSCAAPHNGVISRQASSNTDCPPGTLFANWGGNLFCIAPQ